jgi:cytochrome c
MTDRYTLIETANGTVIRTPGGKEFPQDDRELQFKGYMKFLQAGGSPSYESRMTEKNADTVQSLAADITVLQARLAALGNKPT